MATLTPVQALRLDQKTKRYMTGDFILKIGLLALFIAVPFLFPSFKSVDLAADGS